MPPLLIVGAIGLVVLGAYLLAPAPASATASLPQRPEPMTPRGNNQGVFSVPSQAPNATAAMAGGAALSAAQGGVSTAQTSGAAVGAASAGLAFVTAIGSALMDAHNKRFAQAVDENSAVKVATTGFDSDLHAINAAYNAGQINRPQAIQLIQTLQNNYWAICTPHIQTGRNGCNSRYIPPPRPSTFCSGTMGAACCVGSNVIGDAIAQAVNCLNGNLAWPGGSAISAPVDLGNGHFRTFVGTVFATKYSTTAPSVALLGIKLPGTVAQPWSRAGYSLDWTQ
jgi:hypothetical protein